MKKNYQNLNFTTIEKANTRFRAKKRLISLKLTLIIFLTLVFIASQSLNAQITKLVDFRSSGDNTLRNPRFTQLINKGSTFYGMTLQGGLYNYGAIFKIKDDGSGYKKLFDFDGKNSGANPEGSLIFVGDSLYGMTNLGGQFDYGTIFKIDTMGTGFQKLMDLSSSGIGGRPYGSLTVVGDSLYGMSAVSNGWGSIFKIGRNGTEAQKFLDFDGSSKGGFPYGSLTLVGDSLYGMTSAGGLNSNGVIFKIHKNCTGFQKLFDFDGTNGSIPYGSLTLMGDSLYGMTQSGGTHGGGVLFKIHKSGAGFKKMVDFDMTFGAFPYGSLTAVGDSLCGMLKVGGCIFKIHKSGRGLRKLINFDGFNGGNPMGSLTLVGSVLYGMTWSGGISDNGFVFKINSDGTNFSKLKDFYTISQGSSPSSLTSTGSSLIGTTSDGGKNGRGCIFKTNLDGTEYQKVYDFTTSDGATPVGALTLVGDSLYGVTKGGSGFSSNGFIYKVNRNGSGYKRVFDFTEIQGSEPSGSLILIGDSLYGTTRFGGIGHEGVIFKINKNGTGYKKLFEFDNSNGGYPLESLILIGDSLYGRTSSGERNYGFLYRINRNGSGYKELMDFDNAISSSTGQLSFFGDSLYLATLDGGDYNKGIIFKIHRNGTGYEKLFDFDEVNSGFIPKGPLFFVGDSVYGINSNGGTKGYGTMFRIDRNGKGFKKLLDLDYIIHGANPSSIALINHSLYVTCLLGGVDGIGTIVKCRPNTLFQATDVHFTNVKATQMDIAFTPSNGDKRAVFISEGNTGAPTVTNGITYTANTTFGQGSTAGTGWYCVANGSLTGGNITLTGLTANSPYRVMVLEYTGSAGAEQYLTTIDTGNPANQSTSNNTQTDNLHSEDIQVYPVPATDKLYVKLPEVKSATLEIVNLQGQVVLKTQVNNQLETIHTSSLAKGIYTLTIIADDLWVAKKIEIQ